MGENGKTKQNLINNDVTIDMSEFDNKFPEALKPVVAIITYSK